MTEAQLDKYREAVEMERKYNGNTSMADHVEELIKEIERLEWKLAQALKMCEPAFGKDFRQRA